MYNTRSLQWQAAPPSGLSEVRSSEGPPRVNTQAPDIIYSNAELCLWSFGGGDLVVWSFVSHEVMYEDSPAQPNELNDW